VWGRTFHACKTQLHIGRNGSSGRFSLPAPMHVWSCDAPWLSGPSKHLAFPPVLEVKPHSWGSRTDIVNQPPPAPNK
jgi:hypothetical protein